MLLTRPELLALLAAQCFSFYKKLPRSLLVSQDHCEVLLFLHFTREETEDQKELSDVPPNYTARTW